MSTASNTLLRLPASLRRQTLLHIKSCHPCDSVGLRPVRRLDSKFSTAANPKQADVRSGRVVPAKLVKPSRSQPPAPRPVITKGRQSLAEASHSLAHDLTSQGPVLLYASPKHGLFYLMSYLCGGGFLLGSLIIAQDVLKDRDDRPKLSWWVKALSSVQVLGVTAIGTAFLLAPTKLIRTIKLVPGLTSAQAPSFEFQIQRALPFLRPDKLEAPISSVSITRRVVGEDINPLSVPLKEAPSFIERFGAAKRGAKLPPNPEIPTAPRYGVIKGFKREVRRMFLRDQMAYINVSGYGLFKMDLQGGLLLEGGRPLMSLATIEAGNARNLFARLQSVLSG